MCHFLKIGPVLYEFHHLLKFDLKSHPAPLCACTNTSEPKTELCTHPNSSKIMNFELGLTQTLAIVVDVISKQQIMNESACGEKKWPCWLLLPLY